MKKLLALALSFILIFTLVTPVFAVTETPYEDSEFFEYEGYTLHYRQWKGILLSTRRISRRCANEYAVLVSGHATAEKSL